jgi:hypothetical protein
MGVHSGQHVLQDDQVITMDGIESLLPRPRRPREFVGVKVSVQRVEVPTRECGIESLVIRLYKAAKYPSRLDAAIAHSMTESSADTTASSLVIGGNGAGGAGVATIN